MKCPKCSGDLYYDVDKDTDTLIKRCLKCNQVVREWAREEL